MDIYQDFEKFKEENTDLLAELKAKKSPILLHFAHVIDVVEYYAKKSVGKKLTDDEEVIFEVGFDYIFNSFNTIKMLYEHTFHSNIDEMNKYSKSINLYLYAIDFENDLYSQSPDSKKEIEEIIKFEDKILSYIDKGSEIPETLFIAFDEFIDNLYDKLKLEYNGENEIFYDIAIELNLIKEDDDDCLDIDDILNNQI